MELKLWGDKLGVGPAVMDKIPVVVPHDPYNYHINADTFETEVLQRLGPNGETRTRFLIFVTYGSDKWTVTCELWSVVKNNQLQVETRGLGSELGWAKAEPESSPSLKARLEVVRATMVAVQNKDNKRSVIVNFYYNNYGSLPSVGMVHRVNIVPTEAEIPRSELERIMRDTASFHALAILKQGGDELYPSDPQLHFWSSPDDDKTIQELAAFNEDIVSGKKRVYFFAVMKFKDSSMEQAVVGVNETCGWFLMNFDVVHSCGLNRTYLATEK